MYVHVTIVVPLLGGKLVYYSYKVVRLSYMTFLQTALFLEFLFKFLMLIFNMWLTLLTIIKNLHCIFSHSKLYVSLIGYNCVAMISMYIYVATY